MSITSPDKGLLRELEHAKESVKQLCIDSANVVTIQALGAWVLAEDILREQRLSMKKKFRVGAAHKDSMKDESGFVVAVQTRRDLKEVSLDFQSAGQTDRRVLATISLNEVRGRINPIEEKFVTVEHVVTAGDRREGPKKSVVGSDGSARSALVQRTRPLDEASTDGVLVYTTPEELLNEYADCYRARLRVAAFVGGMASAVARSMDLSPMEGLGLTPTVEAEIQKWSDIGTLEPRIHPHLSLPAELVA